MSAEEEYLQKLTPQEREGLEEFKKNPITNGKSDKYLMMFLFSKKMNVADATKILTNNLQVRDELGIPHVVPISAVNEKLLKAGSMYYIDGHPDKKGRGISYLVPRNVNPKDFTTKDIITHMMYCCDVSMDLSPEVLRNGFLAIQDMKGGSMKNFSMDAMNDALKGKQAPDVFTGRVEELLLVNAPAPLIMKGLMKVAKFFAKETLAKMTISILNKPDELFEYVDAENLHDALGGKLPFDYQQKVEADIQHSKQADAH